MLTRIAGVADIDHVYRRPDDPAHVGLLQQGGACITHDPASWEEKRAHCFYSDICLHYNSDQLDRMFEACRGA